MENAHLARYRFTRDSCLHANTQEIERYKAMLDHMVRRVELRYAFALYAA